MLPSNIGIVRVDKLDEPLYGRQLELSQFNSRRRGSLVFQALLYAVRCKVFGKVEMFATTRCVVGEGAWGRRNWLQRGFFYSGLHDRTVIFA